MTRIENTNVPSLIAQTRLTQNTDILHKAMERLSSGYRINRSSDDAAGLSISENLTSEIRRMQQASRNTQDGIGLLQVAEGSLSVIEENLQRVRELTVQAGNDTNSTTSRQAISNEIQTLLGDIDRIAQSSNFNGYMLLDGSPKPEAYIQIGPNSNATTNVVDIAPVLQDSSSQGLTLVGGATTAGFANIVAVNLSNSTNALNFLQDIDNALDKVSLMRANIGSYQNKLQSVSDNLSASINNFTQSNSQIRDADVAAESATMSQAQVLTQASTMILSQTNQLPQMILQLLKQSS